MSALSEKMRKARQSKLKVGEITLIVTRPTDLEMNEMRGKAEQRVILEKYVVGWEGVKESDLVAGGTPDEVPFDPLVYKEWIADHPEHWVPIVSHVVDLYQAHQLRMEETLKNL